MNVKFNKINIIDFQGIKKFSFGFGDSTTEIKGQNELGKSSILDSILWCLTGKNQDNKTDTNFSIQPLDKNNDIILETSPTVTLEIDVDGTSYVIERKYSLVLPKHGTLEKGKKYKATRVFTINGTSYGKTAFNEEITKILGELEDFKLYSNVKHFNENLAWGNQREIIMSFLKKITHEEIVSKNNEFGVLTELNDTSYNEYLRKLRTLKTKTSEELDDVKSRIEEQSLNLDKESTDDQLDKISAIRIKTDIVNKLDDEKKRTQSIITNNNAITSLEYDIKRLDDEIISFGSNFEANKLKDIQDKEAIKKYRQDDYDKKDIQLGEARTNHETRLSEMKKDIDDVDIEQAIKLLKVDADRSRSLTREKTLHDKDLTELNNKIKSFETNISTFENLCPECGQSLPEETVNSFIDSQRVKIESVITDKLLCISNYEKDIVSINADFDKEIVSVNNSKDAIITKKKEYMASEDARLKTAGLAIVTNMKNIETEMGNLDVEIKASNDCVIDNGKKSSMITKLNNMKEELNKYGSSSQIDSSIQEELQKELDEINEKVNVFDYQSNIKKRYDELKSSYELKKKSLADTLDKESLMGRYLSVKAGMLRTQLSVHFHDRYQFKLLEVTQDGQVNDTFQLIVDGVDYNNVNAAGKIAAGLAIISFLQSRTNNSYPTLIDNFEGVSSNTFIPITLGQVILTKVSEDEELTIIGGSQNG